MASPELDVKGMALVRENLKKLFETANWETKNFLNGVIK
jgi:hypothetical protein